MAADSARSDDAARQVSAPVVRNIVRRTRLFAALDRVQTTPGLLVCGPAGYGKSLLVASWWRERAFPYAAWVNLSFTRSSPGQTWAALVSAIRTTVAVPDAELDSLEALAFTAPQDLPARLGSWFTQQDHDTYLVVDELHTVTGIGVHEQLVELIAAAAARLRLVAITRHDPLWPLHRMRLDGLLCDLRAEDLAFDDVEAAELFSSLGLAVSAERIHQVVVTTQGWAAGLRLAAIGATATDDPDAYLATISGRNRYIADYLLREVFERLGAEWQDFLGRIGVVDEISPELAIALGCGADSGARLAELARRNAFTHQIGDRLGWYRLHPLLLDFLRSRATDESQRRTLHGRAARWFEEQGEPRLAIVHALAAQDWELAADLAGTHVVSWTVRRPPGEFKTLLAQVPREEILTHAGLSVGLAAALVMRGELADIDELLEAARARFGGLTKVQRRRCEFLLELITLGKSRWTGDLEALLASCRRIPREPGFLAALGLVDWLAVPTLLINNEGTAELWTGDYAGALEHLTDASRTGPLRVVALPTLNAQAHLAYLHWMRGELAEADTIGRLALDGFVRMGVPQAIQARSAYLALAGVAIDRDDPDSAETWLKIARRSAGEPHTEFAADLLASRVAAARGDIFQAVATIRDARQRNCTARLPPVLVAQSQLLEAELLSQAGNHQTAREVAAAITVPISTLLPGGDTVRARVDKHLAAARRALSNDSTEAALEELEEALIVAAPPAAQAALSGSSVHGCGAPRHSAGTGHPRAELCRRSPRPDGRTGPASQHEAQCHLRAADGPRAEHPALPGDDDDWPGDRPDALCLDQHRQDPSAVDPSQARRQRWPRGRGSSSGPRPAVTAGIVCRPARQVRRANAVPRSDYQAYAATSPNSASLSTSRPREVNQVAMLRQSRAKKSMP